MVWDELLAAQDGVFTRAQALSAGFTPSRIKANISARRWNRVVRGVYAAFTGAPSRRAQLWAAVLRAGPGAVISHQTAAEVQGLTDRVSPLVHVTVPDPRTPAGGPGVVIHRSLRVGSARHPTRTPPQTRVEETVWDLVQQARSLDDAMGWLARAVGARATTPQRLLAALDGRSRVRWRPQVVAALTDVDDGCHSLLELRYVRDVERAHGLPRGERQVVVVNGGRRRYRDVHYRRYRTTVELDGRIAHPEQATWRDMSRDNAEAEAGNAPLRYGWGDVEERACRVAVQLATVIQGRGWRGRPHPCRRPGCAVRAAFP